MKVAAYILTGNGHAALTCPAMVAGARAQGETVDILSEKQYKKDHADTYDAAIFWGYVEIMQTIMLSGEQVVPVLEKPLASVEKKTSSGRAASDSKAAAKQKSSIVKPQDAQANE